MDAPGVTTAAPAPEGQVLIVNPTTGKRGIVPASELETWAQAGYQPESNEQTTAAQAKQEYGDSPIQAGLEGAARGITVGLSDIALGQLDREGVSQRRKYNQGAALAGELGGTVLGAAFGASPAGLISKGGAAVGEAVAGTKVVKGLGSAAQRYIPAIAGGAAEGVGYGAGTGVTNVALSDDPMTAESVMSEIGTNAILGGVIGGVAGAGGQLLADGAKAGKAYAQKLATREPKVGTIADDVLNDIARPSAPGKNADVDATLRAEKRGLTKEAKGLEAEQAAAQKPTLPDYGAIDPEATYTVTSKELEARGIHELPGAGTDPIRMERARGNLGKVEELDQPIRLTMDKDGQVFVEDGRHRIRAALEEGGERPLQVKIDRGAEGFSAKTETVPITGQSAATDVVEKFKTDYHKLDTAARQNIRQMEGLQAKGDMRFTPELEEASKRLEQARRDMREFLPLEKERSYEVVNSGPRSGYADKQGKSLQTWTGDNEAIIAGLKKPGARDAIWKFEAALDDMQSKLGNKEYPTVLGEHPVFDATRAPSAPAVPFSVPNPGAERVAAIGERMTQIDAMIAPTAKLEAKVAAAEAKIAAAEKAGLKVTDEQFLQAAREGGMPGIKALSDLPTPGQKLLKAQVYEKLAKEMVSKAAPKGSNSIVDIAGAAAGEWLLNGVLGHGLSAIVGGHLGRLVKGSLAGLRGKVAGMAGEGAVQLAKGVDAFLGGVAKAARQAPKMTSAILDTATFAMPGSEPAKGSTAFEKRSSEISSIMGDPMRARRQIHDQLAGIRAADPMLADQMEDLAFRRLMWIGDKMPKSTAPPRMGKQPKYTPSDAEKSQWARVIQTAEDPRSIFDSMAHGTITSEQVDTLKELYPEMYSRIQTDITMRAAELQNELTWKQRLVISTLFNRPTDSILTPQSIQTLQATFEPTESEPSGPGAMKMGAIKPPEATPAQRHAG